MLLGRVRSERSRPAASGVAAHARAALSRRPRLRSVPLESSAPIGSFARLRLVLVLSALVTLAPIDFPHHGRLAVVAAAVALPWAVAIYLLVRRSPRFVLSGAVVAIDLGILVLAQLAAPDSYAGIRFLALFLIAAHAHFQGEQRGVLLAVVCVVLLVLTTSATHAPVSHDVRVFSEVLFAVSAVCAGLFVGRLRIAESAGRLRARDLARRTIETEAGVRRRVAEAIHDGPVQELASLTIMLEAARQALSRGDRARAGEALEESERVAEHAVRMLRGEILGLAPFAAGHLSLNASLEQCAGIWGQRFDIEVVLSLEHVELPHAVCDALFRIAQEAVANAGRHAGADTVTVSLRPHDGGTVLTVSDNGHGFKEGSPLGPTELGHLGLASMRERAELAGGRLVIRSTPQGSVVSAEVPLPAAKDAAEPADG